jgi:uncharacterized protein YgiM (DUF1202 family)
MKAIILDPQVKVYGSIDGNTISIATLNEGSEVEIGPTKRKAGKMWVPVVLSTGQKAYIPGDAKLHIIREGSIMDNNVEMHSEPSAESQVKQQLKRNTRLSILEVIKQENQTWVRVRDISGNEGYIPGETRFRLSPQRSKANGRRSMITGGMWLVAGAIFLYAENPATTSSGLNLIGFAALAFGAIIFISGLVQFLTAPA